ERILSAAACSPELRYVAKTESYPAELACNRIGPTVLGPEGKWSSWSAPESLPGGDVYVSAVPVFDDGRALGFVVLVHDLSFVARREARTREFLFVVFGFLAFAASAVTIIAARIAMKNWSDQVRKLLRGEEQSQDFQPILGDVRELVEQLVAEKESE